LSPFSLSVLDQKTWYDDTKLGLVVPEVPVESENTIKPSPGNPPSKVNVYLPPVHGYLNVGLGVTVGVTVLVGVFVGVIVLVGV
jgi:hypothetical protein